MFNTSPLTKKGYMFSENKLIESPLNLNTWCNIATISFFYQFFYGKRPKGRNLIDAIMCTDIL